MSRSLASLADRRVRVRLLGWSYLDAVEGSNEGGRGSKAGSRSLGHNPQLWPFGSYTELERILDSLPGLDRRMFWRHVEGSDPREASHNPTLVAVTLRMPAMIHVPMAISMAAGFLYGEAKMFSRRHDPELDRPAQKEAA